MEQVAKILPFLWQILGKQKKSKINVTTRENEIIVSILTGRKVKRFKNNNLDILIRDLRFAFCI